MVYNGTMKPKWESIKITLGEIQGCERNPRMSTVAQAKRLIESEKKFGQPLPFLVNPPVDGKYLLLDGHQRLAAWLTVYGAEFVVDVKMCERALTEDEHRELIITLHTGATGSWDWNALSSWDATELQDWGMGAETLKEWNNDALNLKEMLLADKPQTDDAEPQIDRAEELRGKWGVEFGQLWQLGEHRIICGDCTDKIIIDKLGEFQSIFFDPPYDADKSIIDMRWSCNDVLVFTDHRHLLDCVDGWEHEFRCLFTWDCSACWYTPGWPLARAKHCLWFGNGKYNQDGAFYGTPDKPHIVSNPRGEYLYNPDPRGKHLSTIYQSQITKEFDGHSHAKPVEWLMMLIGNCTSGILFDPFAGGGSALIACQNLNREYHGVEISPQFCAVILERFYSTFNIMPELIE